MTTIPPDINLNNGHFLMGLPCHCIEINLSNISTQLNMRLALGGIISVALDSEITASITHVKFASRMNHFPIFSY